MAEPNVMTLNPREKETGPVTILDQTTVGYGPVIDCRAHHYKGIQVAGSADLAGENIDIEVSNDGVTFAPATAAAATNMVKLGWAQVDDACVYLRAHLQAISAGRAIVILHGVLES